MGSPLASVNEHSAIGTVKLPPFIYTELGFSLGIFQNESKFKNCTQDCHILLLNIVKKVM